MVHEDQTRQRKERTDHAVSRCDLTNPRLLASCVDQENHFLHESKFETYHKIDETILQLMVAPVSLPNSGHHEVAKGLLHAHACNPTCQNQCGNSLRRFQKDVDDLK